MMLKYFTMVLAACLALGLAGPAGAAGDTAAGAKLAAKCGGCHGKNGEGKKDNPPLAGMDAAAHVKALQDYKSGARDNKAMMRSVAKLSDQDMADLAAYYAAMK
ncbi:MAG: c-type cytochrome [Alphaproteobacteria bacterium]|nr:c-type cytochrome [Alphaproteobacteria bacterium]